MDFDHQRRGVSIPPGCLPASPSFFSFFRPCSSACLQCFLLSFCSWQVRSLHPVGDTFPHNPPRHFPRGRDEGTVPSGRCYQAALNARPGVGTPNGPGFESTKRAPNH